MQDGLMVLRVGLKRSPKARGGLTSHTLFLSIKTPLGATMSAATSHAAPELGAGRGILGIIEDDYDSEYRFESAPVSSLQGA